MKQKNTAVFLLIILLSAVLSSCGLFVESTVDKGNNGAETTGDDQYASMVNEDISDRGLQKVEKNDPAAEAEKKLAALPSSDFGDVAIIIDSSCKTSFTPDGTASYVSSAKARRNRLVEQKYNTRIIETSCTPEEMLNKATEAVLSGTSYCDILAVPMYYIGIFESKGLLMNLNSIPFTDYSADYYYQDIMDQLTAGYELYGAVGDANFLLNYSYGTFFNKNLIEHFGLDDPYDLVYSESWTYDKMLEMCLSAASDLNGAAADGEPVNEKIYSSGVFGSLNTYTDIIFASSGEHYFTSGFGKIPSVTLNTDVADGIAEKIKTLISGEYGCYIPESASGDAAEQEFISGNMLFFSNRITALEAYANMRDDFGLVPIPKFYGTDSDYYTYCDIFMPVFAVLKTNINIDNTGMFLQAFNAASDKIIENAYYEDITATSIRDSYTLNMLDLISKNYTADFAFAFCSAYSNISKPTFGAMRSASQGGYSFSSQYNNSISALNRTLDSSFSMPG